MGDLDRAVEDAIPARDKVRRIAELLEQAGIDPAEIGRVRSVRIGEHETAVKVRQPDGSDRLETVTQRADSILLEPSWADGPQWPPVQPAAPVNVRVPAAKAKREGWPTALILPDPQIGYRRHSDGTLDPFHDEAAIEVALRIAERLRPDRVIWLGDFLDFPEWGKYEQEPEFQFTGQATIDRGHAVLASFGALTPQQDLLEGNHDRRLPKAIARNAMAAMRLRRADAPDEWPVMSVPHLLRLDELGVGYHDGYPSGAVWINDNLVAIHGHKVRSAASTAAAVIDDERVSTIFGHVHRIEYQSKTRRTREGARHAFAASPGCLCRIDGAVPSAKSATDAHGRPVPSVENWQQGVGVVHYEPGDGRFAYQAVPIFDGWAMFDGRTFEAVR